MSPPTWLPDWLTPALELGRTQQFGLAFLLGSFTVATWSDLKHLSAQREFLDIWLAFLVGRLIFDLYEVAIAGKLPWQVVAVKWCLIGLFSLLSLEKLRLRRGLFWLANADVAALAAAASLLSPVLIVIFYLLAKLVSLVVRPLLQRGRQPYPFMPVVSLTTLAVLALGLIWQASSVPAASAGP